MRTETGHEQARIRGRAALWGIGIALAMGCNASKPSGAAGNDGCSDDMD